MGFFYFFENDGLCKWMTNELTKCVPRYLHEQIAYDDIEEKLRPRVRFEGKKKFYGVLDWIMKKEKGANPQFMKESGINIVNTFDELPEDAGVYIGGYDVDIEAYSLMNSRNTPYIEHPCPWIKNLREQLLSVNAETHQAVLMVIKGHMVYECYKSAFPKDIIIVLPENYKEEIATHRNGKPIHLLVYAAFRRIDAERIIEFIRDTYPHPDHFLTGYKRTICGWVTGQGLIEEIGEAIRMEKLDEVWILCSSDKDTSTATVIREVSENGAKPVVIKSKGDIPETVDPALRVGVLVTAIPLATSNTNLKEYIRGKFCASS